MKRPPPDTLSGIPESQSLRLRLVGVSAYGEPNWISPLAAGISMSRSHLNRLIDGKRSRDAAEIDVRLLHLIAHERWQSERRVHALARLQKKLLAHIEYVAAAKAAYRRD